MRRPHARRDDIAADRQSPTTARPVPHRCRRWIRRASPGTLFGLIALVVATGGVAFAAIPDGGGVIHSCYNSSGSLRVIDTATGATCPKNDTALNFNQTGPQGPQGLKGDQGIPGTNGTNGTDGKDGTNGTNGTNGLPGAQGSPGPSDLYASKADFGPSLQNFTDTTVASLNVPAGSYLVTARVNISNNDSSPQGATCNLSTDTGGYQEYQRLAGYAIPSGYDPAVVGSFHLQDAQTIYADTTIRLQCKSYNAHTAYVRMAAIKVGTLH